MPRNWDDKVSAYAWAKMVNYFGEQNTSKIGLRLRVVFHMFVVENL